MEWYEVYNGNITCGHHHRTKVAAERCARAMSDRHLAFEVRYMIDGRTVRNNRGTMPHSGGTDDE